jgi:dihydrofolate synthase/folylpolyglutamate synthase
MTSTIERYHAAASRLDALIDAAPEQTDMSREAVQRRATFRMDRLRRFLAYLDNPHEGYPIVHVGGTSGKGSTSTMIAAILTASGVVTGLHTSPYLQTPGEKLQLNGQLIHPEQFISLVDQIVAAHDRWQAAGEAPLTYGETWFALTALFFKHNSVDVAVLEVGAGGRFDLTNIVTPILSVITSVGIDHTNTLGETIEDIAWHKAGIIKAGIPALTAVANPTALGIIEDEAALVRSPLEWIDLATAVHSIETGRDGTSWVETASGERFRTAMRGSFQAKNGATAIAAVRQLRSLGLPVSDSAIHDGLAMARIPGRAEIIEDVVPVLLDGAHNSEKVAALTEDIPNLLPRPDGGRRIAVLGILEVKQANDMIEQLVPVIDVLVATAPKVLAKEPKDAARIAEIAREAGYSGPVHIERQASAAIGQALAEARHDRGDSIVVTGSLYLIGNVRERWFSQDAVVLARSSWPGRPLPPSGLTTGQSGLTDIP